MSKPVSPETAPAQKTCFPPLSPLGYATETQDGGPLTAIYVPPGVDTTHDKVNVIFWLHGHKDATTLNAQQYLNDGRFRLREIMERRAARPISATPDGTTTVQRAPNVVFVAPTLGRSDESGTLGADPSGYLDQVKQAMIDQFSFPASLSWPEMVIGCHSGGGRVAKEVATAVATRMDRGGGKLSEIWHFDSIYENDPQTPADPEPTAAWWASWASLHPGTTIKVFHLTTTAHSEYLQKSAAAQGLTNVTVKPSADPVHATVARTHFPGCYDEWLAAMAAAAP